MNLTDTAARGLIRRSFATCGAKLPKSILDAEARAEAVSSRARNLRPRHDELATAVAAALADDRDPTEDAAVQRLAIANALGMNRLPERVAQAAIEHLATIYADNANTLLHVLQQPYAEAAQRLTAARDVIGDTPLEDTTRVLGLSSGSGEAWHQARNAVEILTAAEKVLSVLASYTGLLDLNPHYKPLRHAAVDWTTWIRNGWGAPDVRVTPWELVCADLTLSLPDFEEYRARAQVLDEGMRRAQVEADMRNTAALTGRQVSA